MDWATRVCFPVVASISQAQVVSHISGEMLHTFTAGLINSDLQVPYNIGNFSDWLRTCEVLKKDATAWSLLVLINSDLILNARTEARYVGLTFFSNTIIFHTLLDKKIKNKKKKTPQQQQKQILVISSKL